MTINLRSYEGQMMQTGKEAERIVMAWLRQNPNVVEVHDLSNTEELWKTDTDLLIKTRDGQDILAEVKSCRHIRQDGHVNFEIARIYHNAPTERAIQLGWGQRSPAHYLFVYSPVEKAIYRFNMQTMRSVMQRVTKQARADSQLHWVSTDDTKSTLILLLPLKEFGPHYGRYDVSSLVEEEKCKPKP